MMFINKTLWLRRFWTAAPAFNSQERLVFMLNVDPTSGECYGLQMLIIASDTLILTLEYILVSVILKNHYIAFSIFLL